MKTIEVIAAGYYSVGKDMGDLVVDGILKKVYLYNASADGCDIIWTNISEDVIVKNVHDTILPGESVTWEK